MPFDTPYQQMLHLLSARGLGWFGSQIESLPTDLPPDHPSLPFLAEAARHAPILSALCGTASPLETFLKRRMTAGFLDALVKQVEAGASDATTAQLILTAHGSGLSRPEIRKALRQLSSCPALAPHLRMVFAGRLSDQELRETETLLRQPIPRDQMTEDRVLHYSQQLMLSYGYGACRPQFSTARAYGEIFATCLQMADWARASHSLTCMAQVIYCLCLIDPDTDVAEFVGEIIASQRPDGSFPQRAGHGTMDQDLATATRPTIMAVAALHMAIYRRWRQPPTYPLAA